jgi:hypothetical protein
LKIFRFHGRFKVKNSVLSYKKYAKSFLTSDVSSFLGNIFLPGIAGSRKISSAYYQTGTSTARQDTTDRPDLFFLHSSSALQSFVLVNEMIGFNSAFNLFFGVENFLARNLLTIRQKYAKILKRNELICSLNSEDVYK